MSFISVKPLKPSEVQYRSRDHLKIVGNYALGRRLGEGSYGKVKEGVNIHTKRRVAVKIYAKQYIKKIEGGEASAQKEIEIMKSLRNENVVQAIEDFNIKEKEKLYVVLEYVNGGTLQDLLDRSPNNILPLRQLRSVFKGLISGLLYLQSEGIIHRDIKPDNILLTPEGEVKIGDFGVAVKIDLTDEKALETFKWKQGDIGGSPAFQPPECQEIDYSSIPDLDELGPLITKRDGKVAPLKLDIWSAGVVLYIMVVGKFPFESPNIISLFTNIARGKFTIPESIEEELKDLLRGLLQVDPDNRLSLPEIKKHPWMKFKLPKDNVPMIPTEPISSLFGNDEKTLTEVLEDLQNRKGGDKKGAKDEKSGEENSYTESGSEVTDPSPVDSISDGSSTPRNSHEDDSQEDRTSHRDRPRSRPQSQPYPITKQEKESPQKTHQKRLSSKSEKGFFSRKDSRKDNSKEEKLKKSSSSDKVSNRKLSSSVLTPSVSTPAVALKMSGQGGDAGEMMETGEVTKGERQLKKSISKRKNSDSYERHKKCQIL